MYSTKLIENIGRIIPSMLFLIDVSKRTYIYANDACTTILGFPKDRLLADDGFSYMFSRIHPDDLGTVEQDYKQIFDKLSGGEQNLEEDVLFEMRYRLKDANNKWRWVYTKAIAFNKITDKSVSHILQIVYDITQLKRTEKALLDSEQRYRQLIERVPDGIYRSTPDGRFINVNSALVGMLGFNSHEDLLSVNIPKDLFFDPAERARLVEKLQKGEKSPSVIRLKKKDGSTIWVEDHGHLQCDAKGQPLYYEGVLRDITDRKVAEEELRESQEMLRSITESSPDYIIMLDLKGNIQFINRPIAQFVTEKIIGTSIYDYVPTEYRKGLRAFLAGVVKTKKPDRYEVQYRSRDGYTFLFEASTGPVLRDGKVIALTMNSRDITERRRTEEALRENELRFRALFERNNDAILIIRLDGRMLLANQKAAEMLGYQINELVDLSYQDIVAPDEWEDTNKKIQALQKGISLPLYESKFRKKEGLEFPIEINIALVHDAEGHPLHIQSIVRDISERKQAERALRKSELRFRDLFDNAPDMYIILDPNGIIVDFNKRGLRELGYDEAEILGRPFLDIIHQEDFEKIVSVLNHIHKTSTPPKNIEGRLITKNQKTMSVSKEFSLMKDRSGKLQAIRLLCRDITERRRLEEELARAQRLETAGRVAGQIAHDFNNLLAPLAAYPTLIREELPKDHSALGMIQEIESAAKKIAEINQQLLALGRRGHYSMEIIDLNELLESFIWSQSLPREIGVELELSTQPVTIRGGSAQLLRALTNLFNNAKEAMQGHGLLKVTTENVYLDAPLKGYQTIKRGEYVKASISDNGTGILEENLDKIFDPFFTTKVMDRMRGSGLGLSVVHGIMEDHKGYITVDSTPGGGATFSLYFPMSRKVEKEIKETVETSDGGDEKILVIDDDPVQRRVAAMLLKRLGYQVHAVASGEQAIGYLKQNRQDLLVLDMVMDGIDGAETYRRVLEFQPNQKAIILSGYAMTQRVQEAQRMGAGMFVPKPVTLTHLANAVRQELDKKLEGENDKK